MNKEEIKIITLGDIFRNLETEEQVKSCIDYEFKTSLIKDLKDILKEVSK